MHFYRRIEMLRNLNSVTIVITDFAFELQRFA